MTLPKNVEDAVDRVDYFLAFCEPELADMQTIRAELHRLTDRLEAAEKDAQFLRSHRPIARKLEAANALLRDIHDAGYYRMKIDAHLSEPRT